jgi:hypothetical protein
MRNKITKTVSLKELTSYPVKVSVAIAIEVCRCHAIDTRRFLLLTSTPKFFSRTT